MLDRLPTIPISTTSGNGQRVVSLAVTSTEEKKTFSLNSPLSLCKRVALVDPILWRACLAKVTAATGLDALTMALRLGMRKDQPLYPCATRQCKRRWSLRSLKRAVEDGRISCAMICPLHRCAGHAGIRQPGRRALCAQYFLYPTLGSWRARRAGGTSLPIPWQYNKRPYPRGAQDAPGSAIERAALRYRAKRMPKAFPRDLGHRWEFRPIPRMQASRVS